MRKYTYMSAVKHDTDMEVASNCSTFMIFVFQNNDPMGNSIQVI